MHLRRTTLIRHNNEASMVETRTRLRLLSALYILATLNFLLNHFVYHPSSANNVANLRTNAWKKTIATFPPYTVFSEFVFFFYNSWIAPHFSTPLYCSRLHAVVIYTRSWTLNLMAELPIIIIKKDKTKQSNQQQQRTKFKQFGFLKDKPTTAQLLQSFIT